MVPPGCSQGHWLPGPKGAAALGQSKCVSGDCLRLGVGCPALLRVWPLRPFPSWRQTLACSASWERNDPQSEDLIRHFPQKDLGGNDNGTPTSSLTSLSQSERCPCRASLRARGERQEWNQRPLALGAQPGTSLEAAVEEGWNGGEPSLGGRRGRGALEGYVKGYFVNLANYVTRT